MGEERHDDDDDEMNQFVNHQVDQIISMALHRLPSIISPRRIALYTSPPSISSSSSLSTPSVSIRCRSSSGNDRRERKVAFHHTMPRCSLPATKADLIPFHTRSLSYQPTTPTRCRSSQTVNGHYPNRSCDVQYSFSLNKPWLTTIDKQRHQLLSIQNFVNEFVEYSIRSALLQIDYQQLSASTCTGDASCLLFDCSLSYTPTERVQTINAFADQFVSSMIEQLIEEISVPDEDPVESVATRLTDYVLSDALETLADDQSYSQSLLTDDEKHTRKAKRRSMTTRRLVNNENHESQSNTLFHQIRHRSSSAFRLLTNHRHAPRQTVDSIVNNFTQQIYSDSFEELRRIFTKQQHDR